ncbi:MAG: ATP-binding cassette domain-containing protein [Dysgonamonadaceae bacterium]|jgi:ATPase subunit of ABC transporter with duplicated ATPase domains|nr:ATP-binding cassette domain-containing protein [Dysgonamonadaceae bacterium]
MLILQNIKYLHPDKELLFDHLNMTVGRQDKIALIGNNGRGKSTLLKIMAGLLPASDGELIADSKPYYVPQIFGQFNDWTIAQALQVEKKWNAFNEILAGNVTESNLLLLNDDWTIEERCREALAYWQLDNYDFNQKMELLSGGQKTKVFLAGISVHRPEIVLLDEPSNHLDTAGRELLYRFIRSSACTMVIVSHDRILLNLLSEIHELNKHGITIYSGNYDSYIAQKQAKKEILNQKLSTREKDLRKAKEIERKALERKQRADSHAQKSREKSGIPQILLNARKNSAENSASRLKGVHTEKTENLSQEISHLRKELPDRDKMKFGVESSSLHKGKILMTVKDMNFGYSDQLLWKEAFNFQIASGERIALSGSNGSGKTTFIRLLLGMLEPSCGAIERNCNKTIYIDQDYSLINNRLTVYEQAQTFNENALQEHEIKIRLNRFLFSAAFWDKPCRLLSGGEKMRLMLCCLTIMEQSPDLIVLDEPTNNLDLQNIYILTDAMNEYRGTLIVVSHDLQFIKDLQISLFYPIFAHPNC